MLCLVSHTTSVSSVQVRILMCGLQPAECVLRLFLSLAELPYHVTIFPSRKTSAASTSANAWVTVSGTLGETSPVPIPRGALEFVFRVSEWKCSVLYCSLTLLYRLVTALLYLQHKNLGILTTLRIGHDNSGPSPKWMVEHVLVRNDVTGHTYK